MSFDTQDLRTHAMAALERAADATSGPWDPAHIQISNNEADGVFVAHSRADVPEFAGALLIALDRLEAWARFWQRITDGPTQPSPLTMYDIAKEEGLIP